MDSIKNESKSPDYDSCTRMLENALKRNRKIQRLIDHIQTLGCELPNSFLACRRCDGQFTGGFSLQPTESSGSSGKLIFSDLDQIILCQNTITDPESFEHTITHELIHAYDVCRAKLDFENCLQHACTEIRASSLSGECGIIPEAMRGHLQMKSGLEACTKRRATLSLSMNPNCGERLAGKAVDKVFPKCFPDLSPFEEDEH